MLCGILHSCSSVHSLPCYNAAVGIHAMGSRCEVRYSTFIMMIIYLINHGMIQR